MKKSLKLSAYLVMFVTSITHSIDSPQTTVSTTPALSSAGVPVISDNIPEYTTSAFETRNIETVIPSNPNNLSSFKNEFILANYFNFNNHLLIKN